MMTKLLPAVMSAPEDHNLTEQRDRFDWDNRTEPRVTGHLDAAGCLFLTIVPYDQAVPALIFIFVLLTILTFLANVLTLFGIRWSRGFSQRPRYLLLKNLVLSDLAQIATFSPAIIHSLVHRRTMAFSSWCYVQYFVGTASIMSSLVTITCMAVERYLCRCQPFRYLRVFTEARLRRLMVFIWVYSISVSAVNMTLLHIGGRGENGPVTWGLLCEPDTVEQHMGFPRACVIFRKVTGSFTLLLCLLVYIFSYLKLYRATRNAVVPFNAIITTARRRVLFFCAMLLLQLLPLLLRAAADALWEVQGGSKSMMGPSSQPGGADCKVDPTPSLHLSLLAMLLVPPCINPLVYGLWNVEMRNALFSLFERRTRRSDTSESALERMRCETEPTVG